MQRDLTKIKEKVGKEKISVSPIEKKQAIINSIQFSHINKEVDQIVEWINQEQLKLAKDVNHQAFLALNFNYSDKLRKTVVDTILRLFGTRLLNDEERMDPDRPLSTGLQATNRPNLYVFYEHRRPEPTGSIQEKYTLLVSPSMKMPTVIAPAKIEEVDIKDELNQPEPSETPAEVLEEKIKDGKKNQKTPGIFETINKIFLGEDEEY